MRLVDRYDALIVDLDGVVVGGGPGGMEAARVARERGLRVTLVAAGDRSTYELVRDLVGSLPGL